MINALTQSLKIPEKLGGTFETQGSPFNKFSVWKEKLATKKKKVPTPVTGLRYSNNSSVICHFLPLFDHFLGLVLTRLITEWYFRSILTFVYDFRQIIILAPKMKSYKTEGELIFLFKMRFYLLLFRMRKRHKIILSFQICVKYG